MEELVECKIVGVICKEPTLKEMKTGEKWFKMTVTANNIMFDIKVFDNELSQKAFERYKLGYTVEVIGEPRASSYKSKTQEIKTIMEIIPNSIKLISNEINENKRLKLL